jgi:hypothetical protein
MIVSAKWLRTLFFAPLMLALFLSGHCLAGEPFTLTEASGYRGLWYANQKTGDEYVYKYSGGMATYPQQHVPIAIHAPAVNKTFFVYGGSPADGKRTCLHMVSYFDHATATVPRPRILLDKQTDDAHDNPTLAIDRAGYLWIFSNSHGAGRPSYIHRSIKPHEIDQFELTATTNFSYGQPWALDDGSLALMHTRYVKGHREMYLTKSRDGYQWSEPKPLARIAQGHYQVTWSDGKRVATAFNYHPAKGGLNARTNLYYMESTDSGETWTNVRGEELALPLESAHNAALVHDFEAEGKLVYLKQLQFDEAGRPLILYLISGGYAPGPANAPRIWRVALWNGRSWQHRDVTTSDHNYDFGSLYLEDGLWRLIAPTAPGAQPFGTGGQMEMWTTGDHGVHWRKLKVLTHDDHLNHSYARQPLGAHAQFYALWANGDTHRPSESSLLFTDREGTHVWRLPKDLTTSVTTPEVAW